MKKRKSVELLCFELLPPDSPVSEACGRVLIFLSVRHMSRKCAFPKISLECVSPGLHFFWKVSVSLTSVSWKRFFWGRERTLSFCPSIIMLCCQFALSVRRTHLSVFSRSHATPPITHAQCEGYYIVLYQNGCLLACCCTAIFFATMLLPQLCNWSLTTMCYVVNSPKPSTMDLCILMRP